MARSQSRNVGRLRGPDVRLPCELARGRGVNGCTRAFQALGTGSTPVARSHIFVLGASAAGVESPDHGEWRSLVAHPAGGRAVAGSNPVSPTSSKAPLRWGFCLGKWSLSSVIRVPSVYFLQAGAESSRVVWCSS